MVPHWLAAFDVAGNEKFGATPFLPALASPSVTR
jgi:hypothetical protein